MICKNCGAHLSIEDEKCPYCGTPNPEAVRHRRDMQNFVREFYRTHSSVLKKNSETAAKSVRMVILCVMVVFVLFSIIFMANSWSIGSAISEWQAAANSEKYCTLLDSYEAEGDFLSFATLYEQRNLYGPDVYEEYRHVYTAASNYRSIYGYILALMENEHWEGAHENTFKYLCDALDYHYEYIEHEPYEHYYELGAYEEVHLEAVERINEKIENLLQLCFDLSEEEMAGFQDLSAAEKQVFIERSFQEYE